MAKMVTVHLKYPVWDEKKNLYRPGKSVRMPAALAKKLGIAGQEPEAPREPETKGPALDPEVAQLAAEYDIDLATLTPANGEALTVEDVIAAVEAREAAKS